MLHFVNQTKADFVLKITEDNILCLYKADDESACLMAVQIDVTENDYDDLLKTVQTKLDAEGGTFPIRANRTSKLYVSIPDVSVLYSEQFTTNSMVHMFGKETGLSASEYYYPKSVIFVITDTGYNVDIKYADPASGERPDTAVMRRGTIPPNTTLPGFTVTMFLSNVTKWDKVPDNTFIQISDTLKLKVSVIKKTNANTGAKYTINALIRCDENGNEIQAHRKDEAGRHPGEGGKKPYSGNNGGNGKRRGKKNKKSRTKLSALTSGLPVVDNDRY